MNHTNTMDKDKIIEILQSSEGDTVTFKARHADGYGREVMGVEVNGESIIIKHT